MIVSPEFRGLKLNINTIFYMRIFMVSDVNIIYESKTLSRTHDHYLFWYEMR